MPGRLALSFSHTLSILSLSRHLSGPRAIGAACRAGPQKNWDPPTRWPIASIFLPLSLDLSVTPLLSSSLLVTRIRSLEPPAPEIGYAAWPDHGDSDEVRRHSAHRWHTAVELRFRNEMEIVQNWCLSGGLATHESRCRLHDPKKHSAIDDRRIHSNVIRSSVGNIEHSSLSTVSSASASPAAESAQLPTLAAHFA